MLVFTGMFLLAIAAEVGGRPDILPNGEVLQVEDEFAAVRNSADPTVMMILAVLRRKKYMLKNKEKLWGGAVVTFKMRDLIWTSAQHSYRIVEDAMSDIMQKTCVRFKERSGEPDFVYIDYEFLQASSHSHLGRKGGMQGLNVYAGAFDKRTVLHELGHVLGLEDEHRRPDRDHYIKVIRSNLEWGVSEVFESVNREETNLLGEPFDYNSIMMYHDTSYSKDPKNLKTLVSKTKHRVPTKPTTQLSPGDIRRINDLYRCEGIDKKPKFPFDVACSFDDNSCGFKGLRRLERRQRVWERKKKPHRGTEPEGGYLIWSVKPVEKLTTEENIWSVGFYGTNPHHNIRGQEGCVKFKYSFNTGGMGHHTLKLQKVELESPLDSGFLDYSAKSSSVIWSVNVFRRRIPKKPTAAKWTQVSISVNVLNPFLLDFASILKEGVGEHWVKIDDFEVRYKPCADLNLNRSDSKRSDTNLNRLDPQRSDKNLNQSNSQRKSSWFESCFSSTKLRWFSRKPSRSAKVTPSISSLALASSSISQGKSLNTVHSSFDVENRNKSPRRRT